MRRLLMLAIVLVPAAAQDRAIDTERSTLTVHVGKSGLFSAAGHEHWVNAPIESGVINDSASPRVEFRVMAAKMELKPDPKVDPKTQAEVQGDMQTKTLESGRYPEIAFRSSRVEKLGATQWRVEGELSLHGMSKPVTVSVSRDGEAYAGRTVIKQTDFGIKPVSAVGGTVKVKNELEIEFRILTRP